MTDTETENPSPSDPAQPAGVEAPPAAEVEAHAAAGEPVSFWNRPYVERYLVPLVLPIAVVVGVVVYVLNVSRLFLSAHGHIPVVIGTVITITILVGATVLAAAGRMRQVSVVLLTAGFLLTLSIAGWLSLGHSENKEAGATTLPPTLKVKPANELKVTEAPGGQLAFNPNALNAQTGLAKFDVTFAAPGHRFAFHDVTTLFGELVGTAPTESGVAFFPAPGQYKFYCSVDGHEAAGMQGIVTVTGPPVQLAQALAEAGNPPTAG